jgi:hypothetical protein
MAERQYTLAEVFSYYTLHKANWEKETAHISSTTAMLDHADFQFIVGLGEHVIPYILEDIRTEESWIVLALHTITKDRPDRIPEAGVLPDIIAVWIEWGISKGYIK